MGFDAKRFCEDHRIDWTNKGKHARKGWIQIPCPFCHGHSGYHGGFNLDGGYYNCWRCGFKSLYKVISVLINSQNPVKIKAVIKKYFSKDLYTEHYEEKNYANICKLPGRCGPLHGVYKKYLEKRKYDPEKLELLWDLKASNHIGQYSFRIIAPIYLHGQLISYQGRDVTGKSSLPYMACEIENEVYHHQYTLYGIDNCRKDVGIGVEGIFDVWRLGYGAVGLFGIEFTRPQILAIARKFKRFFILFDTEEQAQEQADKLYHYLNGLGIDTEILSFDSNKEMDPGEMSDDDAKHLMKEINIIV